MYKFTLAIFATLLLSGCLGADYSCGEPNPYNLCSCSGGSCRPATAKEAAASKKAEADRYEARIASGNLRNLTKITKAPSVPADQAYAMCEPQASLAGKNAERYENSNKASGEFSCYKIGVNVECRERSEGGGFYRGALDAMNSAEARNDARDAAMASCLAQFGWRE